MVTFQGADWHTRTHCLIGVLYHSDPTLPCDFYQTCRAVIQQARQDDADYSRAIGFGC